MPLAEENIGKSSLIRVIEWGLNHPDGFGVAEILDDTVLSLNPQEKDIIRTYLQIAYKNSYTMTVTGSGPVSSESLFLILHRFGTDYLNEGNKYVISLDAHFSFIDYQELKFARQNAKEAKSLSVLAILISAAALIIPVIVAVCMTQDVKIDNEQMNSLLNASSNVKIDPQQLDSIKAPDSIKIDDQQANNLLKAINGLKR